MKKELRSLYKKGNEIKPMIENIPDELINEKTNKQKVLKLVQTSDGCWRTKMLKNFFKST